MALLEHMALSATFGAVYGLAHRAFHFKGAIPAGPFFGLALYGLNLGLIAPSLGVTEGPRREPKTSVARRILMHATFGFITAVVLRPLF